MNELFTSMLGELWAMDPRRLEEFLAAVAALDVSAVRPGSLTASTPVAPVNGVARIPIKGPIMRSENPILRYFGIEHTGAAQVRDLVLQAAVDPSVKTIELDVDSPGGEVSAAREIAEDVYALRSLGKRVATKANGSMASAAYWIGSQADHVSASSSTAVGAIGVYATVVDSSKAAEAQGVKVHVISSHELKGAGVAGSPLTDAQRADIKRNIDTYARMFTSDIERGRPGKIDMEKAATGQVWIGGEARLNGLVDSITASPVAAAPSRVTTTAPLSAQENQMEIETLKAELAAKDAELAKLKAKAEADATIARSTAIDAIKAKYVDRYFPADVAAIDSFAAKLTPAEFEEYLSSKQPKTHGMATPVLGTAPSAAAPQFTDLEKRSAEALGSTPERLAFFRTVESRFADGSALMRDGRKLTRAAFEKLIPALALVLAIFAGSTAHATALSAAKAIKCKGTGNIKSYTMADSSTIYSGGMVMVNSSGLAVAAAASASNHGVVGVSTETKTSAATGSCVNGTCTISVQEGWCLMVGTTLGQEDVGNLVYAEDDQTVDDSAGANEPVAGMLVQYVGASSGWVHVSSIYTVRDAVADPLTLTGDFTGGGGAGAITLTDSASSILIPNNDTTALDIGSSGLTNAMRFSTATGLETVLFTAGVGNAAVSVTTDTTLDASDCGKAILITAAFDTHTITLPALSAVPAGCLYRLIYIGANAGALVDVSPNAADGIEGGCTLAASVVYFSGTDDADVGITKATIKKGDFLNLISGDTDDWYTVGAQGICANN